MNWMTIENEGLVAAGRIVAIGLSEAAPMRRLVQQTPASHVIVLTGGQKRQTVLVLDSGHVVITSLTAVELLDLLRT
ncbi:MAG: DUF370 domain-containing protein [Anaerolineae bacterium]|nr:DUF370 domain-containing protein [Anaerolineae bacterium]